MRGGRYADPDADRHLDLSAITAPATPDAERWHGWGTALKPAFEPVVVARKPVRGTVTRNVVELGTGALHVDACRVPFASAADEAESKDKNRHADFGTEAGGNAVYGDFTMVQPRNYEASGRWPSNVLLDDAAAAELDEQGGVLASRAGRPRSADHGDGWGMTATGTEYGDIGGASRFFPTFRYEPKAPAAERPRVDGVAHPTVKPLDLIAWLVRLVTPRGGLVLDPFAGSGTTGEAALAEGMRVWLVEREDTYLPLIAARLGRDIPVTLDLGL